MGFLRPAAVAEILQSVLDGDQLTPTLSALVAFGRFVYAIVVQNLADACGVIGHWLHHHLQLSCWLAQRWSRLEMQFPLTSTYDESPPAQPATNLPLSQPVSPNPSCTHEDRAAAHPGLVFLEVARRVSSPRMHRHLRSTNRALSVSQPSLHHPPTSHRQPHPALPHSGACTGTSHHPTPAQSLHRATALASLCKSPAAICTGAKRELACLDESACALAESREVVLVLCLHSDIVTHSYILPKLTVRPRDSLDPHTAPSDPHTAITDPLTAPSDPHTTTSDSH